MNRYRMYFKNRDGHVVLDSKDTIEDIIVKIGKNTEYIRIGDSIINVTEIAIIGAGSAGLSVAYQAASAGADVLVIDENKLPGGQLLELGL